MASADSQPVPALSQTTQNKFGRGLRRYRLLKSMSQEQLAAEAKLNRSYLGEIERGEVSPSLAIIEKLAAALELTASALLAHAENSADSELA